MNTSQCEMLSDMQERAQVFYFKDIYIFRT